MQGGALAWGCGGALGTRGTASSLTFCLGGREMAPQKPSPNGEAPLGRVPSYGNPTSCPPATLSLVPTTCSPATLKLIPTKCPHATQAGFQQMSMCNCQAISGRIRAANVCSILPILLVLLLIDRKRQFLHFLRLQF